MAERIPIVVISGSPALSKRTPPYQLHHTFDDPDAVRRVFEPITMASISLDRFDKAPGLIDSALQICLSERGPVYLELPVDMVDQPCSAPGEWIIPKDQPTDEAALADAVAIAAELLTKADEPIIWSGHEIRDYDALDSLLRFAEHTGYPVLATRQSKGIFPETHPHYAGIYQGRSSRPEPKALFESAGAMLAPGVWLTNINTGGYSMKCDSNTMVLANCNRIKIGDRLFEPVGLKAFLDALIEVLPSGGLTHQKFIHPNAQRPKSFNLKTGAKLTSDRFFDRLSFFLQPEHYVLADVGGPMIGSSQTFLPSGMSYTIQGFYLSIGYTLPAALGAGLAAPEKRPVVLIGDGALQMTPQEISTLVRQKLNPIIFVINNDGYQIERAIHDGPFNDLQSWNFHLLPKVFGGGWGRRVRTEDELEDALAKTETDPDALALIEVMLDRWDLSETMRAMFF